MNGGSARRKAATWAGKKKENKLRQTCNARVGFERTAPVFEWAKAFHALDRAATYSILISYNIQLIFYSDEIKEDQVKENIERWGRRVTHIPFTARDHCGELGLA
jgi:hypothetical protein